MVDPEKWDDFTMKLTEKWISIPRIYRLCLIHLLMFTLGVIGWTIFLNRFE